jgi:hypothetical protein
MITTLEKEKPHLLAIAEEWEKQENLVDSGDFYDKYKPISVEGSGLVRCFETYDEDLEFVKKQPNNKIWTVINTEGQDIFCQGYHFVNRMHYMVATVPYKEGDKDFFIDWVDAIHCHRCDIHADNKEDLLRHFYHRNDTWWADDNYEIVCRTCYDDMKEENEDV